MSAHTPMRVTATLETGIAHAGPWGIALDGLLAAQLHDQAKTQLAEDGDGHTPVLEVDDPPVIDLPLARCGTGQSWHWAATCAWPVDGHSHRPDVTYWMSKADHRDLEQLATSMPKTVSDHRGRYRGHHMPIMTTICTAVTWHAVGDVDRVRTLLLEVAAIGKKRRTGHGRVLTWTITPAPELTPWRAGHLHPDGTLGRPVPTSCLTDHPNTLTTGVGPAGIRPPYIHPATQQQLHLPVHPSP